MKKHCRFKLFSRFFLRLCIPPAVFLLLYSCGNGENTLSTISMDETLLSGYHAVAHPAGKMEPVDAIDCYLDYSLGMGEGMRVTAVMNNNLKNFLVARQVTYYRVGVSDSPPVMDINSPQSDFMNLDNYREAGSKLKAAIDRIVKYKNKTAVFITDFERVDDIRLRQNLPGAAKDHPIDASAWAQNEFKDWLYAGNQIDIFAKQYSKPDYWFGSTKKPYQNWIYTLVFTPGSVLSNESKYKLSVLKFLENEYLNANGSESKHFVFNTGTFLIEQEKKEEEIGDANDNLPVQELIVNTKKEGFEYYAFKSGDLKNLNTDNSLTDKRIINKVKITATSPCFSAMEFGMNVTDISRSMLDYYNSQHQEAPEIATDQETGKKDTVSNKPRQYVYTRGDPANTLFDFVYNSETKETGIKLKEDFSGLEQSRLFKIDITIKSAKLKDQPEADEVLRLNYANNYQITSLGESIRLVMNDAAVAIENKVIYTIYIRIDP